jgi:hypothetical protein
MTRTASGIALLPVLILAAALTIASAAIFLAVYLDAEVASNSEAAREAFWRAEAGVQHVWALLGRAPDFAEAAAWPAGVPPGLDGGIPYRVRVVAANTELVVRSEAAAHRFAEARIEATFRRAASFRPPAALLLDDSLTAARLEGSLAVDIAASDTPGIVPIGAEGGRAALLCADRGARLVGPSGLSRAAAALRETPDREVAGTIGDDAWGTDEAPELVRVAAPAEIAGSVTATGILVAEAPLVVRGRLRISGLLLGVDEVEVTGSLEVEGVTWIGRSLVLRPEGRLLVRLQPEALDRADALRPGVLPREAVLGAWREVW